MRGYQLLPVCLWDLPRARLQVGGGTGALAGTHPVMKLGSAWLWQLPDTKIRKKWDSWRGQGPRQLI